MTKNLAVSVGEYNLGRANSKKSVTGWSKTRNHFLTRFFYTVRGSLTLKRAFCFAGKL